MKIKQVIIMMVVVVAIFAFGTHSYTEYVMEKNTINNIVKSSQEDVKRLQMVREYYTKFVVGDVKKNTKEIGFSFDHKANNVLPFPTTVIHDLTKMYSSRSDVKIELYSEYPFLNRKNRVLTPFQKEAIAMVEKNDDGVYYKKDVINGKKVLRVAVADYMLLPACVNCHNSHKLKNWPDNKWKLGDKRGILEIITPIK